MILHVDLPVFVLLYWIHPLVHWYKFCPFLPLPHVQLGTCNCIGEWLQPSLMRPVSGESDGPAPERVSRAFPSSGPVSSSEMSSLQSLGPVQSWLGQELEKCGIDAVIYTRYVLSLLLHDSYDYDLQDQVWKKCIRIFHAGQCVNQVKWKWKWLVNIRLKIYSHQCR